MAAMGGMLSIGETEQKLESWLEENGFLNNSRVEPTTGLGPNFLAARQRNYSILTQLEDAAMQDEDEGAASLFLALDMDDSDLFKRLFAYLAENLNYKTKYDRLARLLSLKNRYGMTLPHLCAATGNLDILAFLTGQAAAILVPSTTTRRNSRRTLRKTQKKETKMDVDGVTSWTHVMLAPDNNGNLPIWSAARYGHLDAAKMVFEAIEQTSWQFDESLLKMAISVVQHADNALDGEDEDVLSLPSYPYPDRVRREALQEVRREFPRTNSPAVILEWLLQIDKNRIILLSPFGTVPTPVFLTGYSGDLEMLDLIVQKLSDADLPAKLSVLRRAAMGAASAGRVSTLEFLESLEEEELDLVATCAESALSSDHVEVLAYLHSKHPDRFSDDLDADLRCTIISVAARHGALKSLKFLAQNCFSDMRYAVTCVVHLPNAQFLLGYLQEECGVDLNEPDTENLEGDTLFLACARRRLWSVLQVLHRLGCSPDWRSPVDGKCAAHFAAHAGNLEVLKWMDSIGVNFDEPSDSDSMSVVGFAISTNHVDVLDWVIGLDGDHRSICSLNARCKNSWGLVTIAVYFGSLDALKWLHHHGCGLNKLPEKAEGSHVALAAAQGHAEVVEWLLSKGCEARSPSRSSTASLATTFSLANLSSASPNVARWFQQLRLSHPNSLAY